MSPRLSEGEIRILSSSPIAQSPPKPSSSSSYGAAQRRVMTVLLLINTCTATLGGGRAALRGGISVDTASQHRLQENGESGGGVAMGKQANNCTAEEARLGAEYLLRGHRVGMDELLSGRHMDDWARAMALLDPRPAKVLVSVGMGSGLGLARWLGHWRAELGICETTWAKEIELVAPSLATEQGRVYRPCELLDLPVSPSDQPTVLFGVEPVKATIRLVEKVLDGLLAGHPNPNVKAVLVQAAVADSTGEAMFTDCNDRPGRHDCGISGGEGSIRVPMVTIDSLVKQHYDVLLAAGGVIDVLAIDAGGYEPLVLQGASRVLEARRVRVVKFEYQPVGPWDRYQLGDVISDLDGLGYDCYFEADHRVVRLTGCWHPDFEIYVWSTVTCVVRGDPWRWVMEEHRVRLEGGKAEQ